MKKLLTIVIITIVFLSSCTISQTYHFNKDFSGYAETSIEMGELISFVNSMDTTGNPNSLDTLDNSFNKVAEEFIAAGAKNVKSGWKDDKTTLFVKYDFESIDNLNTLIKELNNGSLSKLNLGANPNESIKFTKRGKRKLIYDAPEVNNDTLKDNKQLMAMKDYMKYRVVLTFENEIKSAKNKNSIISSDNKSVEITGDIMNILSDGYTTDNVIKLRK